MDLLWAHSGDSHYLEPGSNRLGSTDLRGQTCRPPGRADAAQREDQRPRGDRPRRRQELQARPAARTATKKDPTTGRPIIELDMRPPGAHDMRERLKDHEWRRESGARPCTARSDCGAHDRGPGIRSVVDVTRRQRAESQRHPKRGSDRFVPGASLPAPQCPGCRHPVGACPRSIGCILTSLPTGVPDGMPDWNAGRWEPLWATAEDAGLVLGFHIGTESGPATPFRGPGGAVVNYVEITYGGQRVARSWWPRARSTVIPRSRSHLRGRRHLVPFAGTG